MINYRGFQNQLVMLLTHNLHFKFLDPCALQPTPTLPGGYTTNLARNIDGLYLHVFLIRFANNSPKRKMKFMKDITLVMMNTTTMRLFRIWLLHKKTVANKITCAIGYIYHCSVAQYVLVSTKCTENIYIEINICDIGYTFKPLVPFCDFIKGLSLLVEHLATRIKVTFIFQDTAMLI